MLLLHPLFWTPADVMVKVRVLKNFDTTEAELRAVLEGAGLRSAYLALAVDWKTRIHPPLLAALSAFRNPKRERAYGFGMLELCRFVRNAHEHPPGPAALPSTAGAEAGAGVEEAAGGTEAGRAVVAQYLVEALPELALSVGRALEVLTAKRRGAV